MSEKSGEKGNVFWLVLIGIFSFALLSLALRQSDLDNDAILSKEQARLKAEEILQYAANVKTAVNRVILYNGGDDTAIRFAHAQAHAGYGVYGTDPKNEVFNPDGGGAIWQDPPPDTNNGSDYAFMGRQKITGIGTGVGAAGAELTLVLFSLGKTVCEQINKILAHSWSTVPNNTGIITLTRFAGTYVNGDTVAGTGNELVGKYSSCFRETGAGQRYVFTYVLRAR